MLVGASNVHLLCIVWCGEKKKGAANAELAFNRVRTEEEAFCRQQGLYFCLMNSDLLTLTSPSLSS